MDIKLSSTDLDFQAEVGEFLEQALTADLRLASRLTAGTYSDIDACMRWHRILAKKGWIAPAWPEEFGGTGWDDMQRYIFGVECYKAGAPLLFNMGVRHIGPVLMAHGTNEQRELYIPRILSGEDIWCQGYSEPGAGSDLAALKTKAVREGDEYVLNGTKIWTTGAHFAQQIFCLVRTSDEGKKQAGITFLVMPIDTPGLRIEPILCLNGLHEFNQVVFEDVRVPVENRVGAENDGWQVAKVLMQFARSNNINMAWVREGLQRVVDAALIESAGRGPLIEDEAFKRKLNETEVRLMGVEMLELRVLAAMSRDANPGAITSMLKARSSELIQDVSELMCEAVGWYGFPFQLEALDPYNAPSDFIGPEYALPAMCLYLNQRSTTIASGTSEIQRDVLAKRVLGL